MTRKNTMKRSEITVRISVIDSEIKSSKKRQKKVSSDFAYWGYVKQQEELKKEKQQLQKDLYYLDLKEALTDFLNNEDVVQNKLRREIFKILDEHKAKCS